jgi:hypothetical protein
VLEMRRRFSCGRRLSKITACDTSERLLVWMNLRRLRCQVVGAHDKAGGLFFNGPRRRASMTWSIMRIVGYLGFLIVWLLAPAPIAITVAAPVVAPDATQSPPQPTPGELNLLNLLD